MQSYIFVGLGGMLGSILRFAVSSYYQKAPLGTFIVNILGCLLIGYLSARIENVGLKLLLLTGFLGGFTTFSTFGLETFQMLKDGDFLRAALYVSASVVLGILAVFLGTVLASN